MRAIQSPTGLPVVEKPSPVDNETILECRTLRARAERLDGEVRRELDQIEDAALRVGVWPGKVRVLREKHGI